MPSLCRLDFLAALSVAAGKHSNWSRPPSSLSRLVKLQSFPFRALFPFCLQASGPVCFSSSAIYSLHESREGICELLKRIKDKNALLQAQIDEVEGANDQLDALPSLANQAAMQSLVEGDEAVLAQLTSMAVGAGSAPLEASLAAGGK